MNGDYLPVVEPEAAAAEAETAMEAEEDSATMLPQTPDDAVYCNKQLIAYLLKKVCSTNRRRNGVASRNNANGNSRSSSSNNSSSYSNAINNNNNNNGHGAAVVLVRSDSIDQHSATSRSHSPEDDDVAAEPEVQHQIQLHQRQQHQHQQRRHLGDSVDGAPATSDYLSASSASGLSGASPAYVSPFAMSPLPSEGVLESPWSRPAISLDVLKSERTAELERVLIRLCDEFEERLHGRFDSFSSRLDTAPATIRESVTSELETLFYDDNVHWGRIIAVFVLAKEICDKCLSEGQPELSAAVQQWVAEFIDQHLWRWVRQNQGWYGLIKFYQQTGGDGSSNGGGASGLWQPLALLLTVSAVSVAVLLTANYFRR